MKGKREFDINQKWDIISKADQGKSQSKDFNKKISDWANKYEKFNTSGLAGSAKKYFDGLNDTLNKSQQDMYKIFKAAQEVENDYAGKFGDISFEMGLFTDMIKALLSVLQPIGPVTSGTNPFDAPGFAERLEKAKKELLDNVVKEFGLISSERLANVNVDNLPPEYREAYFNEIYKRLSDSTLSAEEAAILANALRDKMTRDDRMKFVFNENGEYGGNQSNPAQRFQNDPDFVTFMQNLLPGMTNNEIRAYLNGIHNQPDPANNVEGFRNVGCGYIAMANAIIVEYANRPDEFERVFGFPMYTYGADGNVHFNVDMLAVEMYHNYGTEGEGTTNISRKSIIEEYMDDHSASCQATSNKNTTTSENISRDLQNGVIILRQRPCIIRNMDGTMYQDIDGGHAIVVTGVQNDGMLIVSTWGGQYLIDPSDYTSQGLSNLNYTSDNDSYLDYEVITFEKGE